MRMNSKIEWVNWVTSITFQTAQANSLYLSWFSILAKTALNNQLTIYECFILFAPFSMFARSLALSLSQSIFISSNVCTCERVFICSINSMANEITEHKMATGRTEVQVNQKEMFEKRVFGHFSILIPFHIELIKPLIMVNAHRSFTHSHSIFFSEFTNSELSVLHKSRRNKIIKTDNNN